MKKENNSEKVITEGTYIEGNEIIDEKTKEKRRMRMVVETVALKNKYKSYVGKADDEFGGTRTIEISEEDGEIKVIENEKPFECLWWAKEEELDAIEFDSMSRAVVMTADLKCIVRGSNKTKYELVPVNVKSRRTIREFRGLNTASSFAVYGRIYLSKEAKELYNTDKGMWNKNLPKLIAVRVTKSLSIII